ncbi:MAG: GFA family protein, partial [Pseudobdellovibrionaceae bacterium]
MIHNASCCCGQLKLKYDGEITKTTVCHCLQCQKRTGSVFGVQTAIKKAQVVITGDSTVFQRTGEEGAVISFHFCPKCGSTVYYEGPWLKDAIAVPIGAFGNPGLPTP